MALCKIPVHPTNCRLSQSTQTQVNPDKIAEDMTKPVEFGVIVIPKEEIPFVWWRNVIVAESKKNVECDKEFNRDNESGKNKP